MSAKLPCLSPVVTSPTPFFGTREPTGEQHIVKRHLSAFNLHLSDLIWPLSAEREREEENDKEGGGKEGGREADS